MTQVIEYMVVENAGYVGERDVKAFAKHNDAEQWIENHYSLDEYHRLHVAVRRDVNGLGEYV